jgi:hypothetical protein
MNRRNPQCCCEVAGCCEVKVIKPLPLRTAIPGGGASYSDTAWNASYVSGISGTDNTIPANTTVTISVPIGCTDYAVDVEVLDDAGQNVADGSPGLRIKVGDCLQAQNYLQTQTSPQSDVYEWPTIISQHDADTVERDTFDGVGNITRPFYGDEYIAYRFYEVFHNAAMNSGIASFIQPPFRFDVSTSSGESVNTRRLPHDAGGLTVQITIETGSYPVEIGLIQVHSGHVSCSTISSLDGVPTDQICDSIPVYTVTDPDSFITNNGPSVSTIFADGDVIAESSIAYPSCSNSCSFDYDAELDISIWTGNHAWNLIRDPLIPYGSSSATLTDATTAQSTELSAYLTKVASHGWTHSDVLIDHRMFKWYEPELDCDQLSLTHTLSITGTCNITASNQAALDSELDAYRDDYCTPSGGPLTLNGYFTSPCINAFRISFPHWCNGFSAYNYGPGSFYNLISFISVSRSRRNIPVIDTQSNIQSFFNLAPAFTYPNASSSVTAERDYSFTRSAYSNTITNVCGDTNSITYGNNAMDIDVTEDATITKIPEYSETDLVYTMNGGRDGGFYTHPLATRDKHLQSLSLYIADESATFTASIGTVMIPTAVDYSGTRPDYATCGCPCTASTIYSDDLYTTGSPTCVYWHRWMEFTDGTDTWYCKWEQVFGFPSTWTFIFRRASDCKEIEFTGVSATVPSTVNSVQKTSTNANSDTLSITVYT